MAADKRKQKAKGKSRVTKQTQAAAKDPGPPYRALWHPATDAERDASRPPEERVAMLHAVQIPVLNVVALAGDGSRRVEG
jgi:uncharacterized ferritin-like protein (DUF455 family)